MNQESPRQLLTGSICLYDTPAADGTPTVFEVLRVVGEGGSTVAYQAVRHTANGRALGILKEFYPLNGRGGVYHSLRRAADGQLLADSGIAPLYRQECSRFLSRYRLVNEVIAESPDSAALKNYIEQCQPFYGASDGAPGTVYVFSPGLNGVGFDRWLQTLHSAPADTPEQTLLQLLQTVCTLTDAVLAMHTAGLLHLDLKPSNFLVAQDSESQLMPAHISLFDINTIKSVLEPDALDPTETGTPGYRAPELPLAGPSDRSDLYSLGAILFRSIVLCPDTVPDGRYRSALYHRLPRLLQTSRLLAGSEVNSDPLLLNLLARILEKTLADQPDRRYNGLAGLKQDLQRAVERIRELQLTPLREEGAAAAVMQKLLYRHPLYLALDGEQQLDVLVLGAGAYAQSFLDAALQAGQNGFALQLTAVSDAPEQDAQAYLRLRPALDQFVAVQHRPTPPQPYAALRFAGLGDGDGEHFSHHNDGYNLQLLCRLLQEDADDRHYRYSFVSLGSDSLNRAVARTLADAMQQCYGRCYPVFYAASRQPAAVQTDDRCTPVWVQEPLHAAASLAPELDQMALNTHLCWLNSSYDLEAVRREFFDPDNRYNYTSSLASALSIPYKLYGLGLLDPAQPFDPLQAARRFEQQVLAARHTDPKARRIFDRLVWCEHRRWVMEKLCTGWQAPLLPDGTPDVEHWVRLGRLKDEAARLHPCILRSTPAAPLQAEAYRGRAAWDAQPIDPTLDPLDRLSVALHQAFERQAAHLLRSEDLLQCAELRRLRTLCTGDKPLLQAFALYEFALKNLLGRSADYAKRFGGYSAAVAAAARTALPLPDAEQVQQLLNSLQKRLFCLLEANRCRDYKASDQAMILQIPFILTNRPIRSLGAVLFGGPSYRAAASNVASATVLDPDELTYFFCVSSAERAQRLVRRLATALQYLRTRKNHCRVRLIAGCTAAVSPSARQQLEQQLAALQQADGGRLQSVQLLDCATPEECRARFVQHLQAQPVQMLDCTVPLLPTGRRGAANAEQLAGLLPQTLCFAFDPIAKQFSLPQNTCQAEAAALRYLPDHAFLRVEDLFALAELQAEPDLPEFVQDIDPLWQLYTKALPTPQRSRAAWNALCAALADYHQSQPPLARLQPLTCPDGCTAQQWLLPGCLLTTLAPLVQQLVQSGAALPGSEAVHFTSDCCRVRILTDAANHAALNRLFCTPHLLTEYYAPTAVTEPLPDGSTCVLVRSADPAVTALPLPHPDCAVLLRALAAGGWLIGLRCGPDDADADFIYTGRRIRQLLTAPRQILQCKAYCEALRSGCWDDLAANVRLTDPAGGDGFTVDLVLCRGFRCMLCVCVPPQQLPALFHSGAAAQYPYLFLGCDEDFDRLPLGSAGLPLQQMDAVNEHLLRLIGPQ